MELHAPLRDPNDLENSGNIIDLAGDKKINSQRTRWRTIASTRRTMVAAAVQTTSTMAQSKSSIYAGGRFLKSVLKKVQSI
jgi:hypothetical protein